MELLNDSSVGVKPYYEKQKPRNNPRGHQITKMSEAEKKIAELQAKMEENNKANQAIADDLRALRAKVATEVSNEQNGNGNPNATKQKNLELIKDVTQAVEVTTEKLGKPPSYKDKVEKGLHKVPSYLKDYKAPAAPPVGESVGDVGNLVREVKKGLSDYVDELNRRINVLEAARVTDGKIIYDLCQLVLERGIPIPSSATRLTPLQQITAEKRALKTEESKEKIQNELRIIDLPEVDKYYKDGHTHKVKEKENAAKFLNKFIKKRENRIKPTEIEYAKRLRTKESPDADKRTKEDKPDVLIVGLKNKEAANEAEANYRSYYNLQKVTSPDKVGRRLIQKSMTQKQRKAQQEAYELCKQRNANKMARLGLKSPDELQKIWIVRYDNGDPDPKQVINKKWSGYVDSATFEANKKEILQARKDARKAEKAKKEEEKRQRKEAAAAAAAAANPDDEEGDENDGNKFESADEGAEEKTGEEESESDYS